MTDIPLGIINSSPCFIFFFFSFLSLFFFYFTLRFYSSLRFLFCFVLSPLLVSSVTFQLVAPATATIRVFSDAHVNNDFPLSQYTGEHAFNDRPRPPRQRDVYHLIDFLFDEIDNC